MHHYEFDKHSARRASAHFRYRSSGALPMLFDELDDVPRSGSSGAHTVPTLSEIRIAVPSFSAFLAAHHRTREARTLDVDDVPELVSVSDKILRLLADGEFHLITEIRDAAGVLSYDRRLRDLRQLVVTISGTTYYLHVDARRSAPDSRLFEYRARIETFPQTRHE
jgi:hypothetical protein